MLALESGLYLRVKQLPGGPTPLPLASGFNADTAYRALGLVNVADNGDASFVFSNDHDEIWFICNRHLRCCGFIGDESKPLRLALNTLNTVNTLDTPEVRVAVREAMRAEEA